MPSASLNLTTLERRDVPATFGIPWNDPRHLTLSFAPDLTSISAATSSLFQTLNAGASSVEWQREILRAAAAWASVANIDVGVISDIGLPFGTFNGTGVNRVAGDIRIGAANLAANALAIGSPPDPFFGAGWSGEIIYNAANQLDPAQANLFSIFAHEFGHAFGIANSAESASVMYDHATTPAPGLHFSDVAAIQSLYGLRQPDQYDEHDDNGNLKNATHVNLADFSSSTIPLQGQFPVVVFGDVTDVGDVDFYRVDTPVGYTGPLTFRLATRGISLLTPKLSVFDRFGNVQGISLSTEPGGDTVIVHINQAVASSRYYMSVEASTADEFGVGRYAAAVTYDSMLQPEYAARLDSVMTGPYDRLKDDDLVELFLNPETASFNDDLGTDDDTGGANVLAPNGKLFSAVGAIQSATDIDVYRVKTGDQSNSALTISVFAELLNGGTPRVDVLNAAGESLEVTVLYADAGRTTVQLPTTTENTDYFVRLTGPSTTERGNYSLTVVADSQPAAPQQFTSGVLENHFIVETLTVAQSQVFHFLLNVNGPTNSSVRLTIAGPTGIVYDVTTVAGQSRNSLPVLLRPGTYTLRFVKAGARRTPVAFFLLGAVLSDPIGPGIADPTQNSVGPSAGIGTYYFQVLLRLKSQFTAVEVPAAGT